MEFITNNITSVGIHSISTELLRCECIRPAIRVESPSERFNEFPKPSSCRMIFEKRIPPTTDRPTDITWLNRSRHDEQNARKFAQSDNNYCVKQTLNCGFNNISLVFSPRVVTRRLPINSDQRTRFFIFRVSGIKPSSSGNILRNVYARAHVLRTEAKSIIISWSQRTMSI